MKRILPLLLITACGGSPVTPTVEDNYGLELLHPVPHSYEANWQAKMQEASAVDDQEESLLESSTEPHVKRWRDRIDHLRTEPRLVQITEINRIVNSSVKYEQDYEHWNRIDRWGYPFESLVEGGDCEDFAILKMESLKHLGWEEEHFAVLVGFTNFVSPAEQHAVLLATMPGGEQLIMDSLEDLVEPPKRDHHFKPLYAVTREHIYHVSESG